MALELIGGSILSALVEVLVDRLASREVLDFFKSHKLDDGLLEKLNETLNTVNGLLDDAEEKQITKRAVKNWLNDVKHAVYEAEDILDEINYEYLRSKDIDTPRPDSNWVRDRVPFLNPANRRMKEMGAELQKILEKLERLLKHKGDLRHIEGTGGWRPLSEKTTPLVNKPDVYGRDADKEAIMEFLLTKNNTNGANVGVIPIVGMGGVGKTTLAQLIYKDRRVEECFELKAWVWASQQFDVAKIIKDIIKKIKARTCPTKEPDESLMEALKGKKLLLVLDDAWNIEYNEWDKLLLPLRYVEHGSKIVVTTRDEDVAKVTQTVIPFHRLNVISDEDCWKLFARDAFSGVNFGAVSHLEAFGREIVRKCKGLPLAAKTLGGLLHSVGDVGQWEKISTMALELIGGSILSAFIEVLVDRLASREVLGFFKSHKLDGGLLEKLNETLNTVNGLLDDAEEKQITKRAVKNWLNDVKHAVYEAEDILDEIHYECLGSNDIDAPRPDSNWVRNLVPFLNPANGRMKEMEAELQRIIEKLERLLKHKGDLRHKASSRPGRKRKTVAGSRNNEVTTGEVAEKLLDAGESSRPGEKSGWTLLMTNLILEIASAVFDQLDYASIGMVLAFVALLLATAELIYMARKEKMSLLPCFHRPSTSTSAPGEPAGTIVEYFGLVGAVWQCFYSTVEYAYARQKKDNPIKMCLLPFLFLSCVVFSKLIKK